VGRDGQAIAYSIRYDPADITRLALFCEDQWVGDVRAKELQRADGSYEVLSLWESQMAKNLSKKEQPVPRDWLAYINEIDELTRKRTRERRQARRVVGATDQIVDEGEGLAVLPAETSADYTQLLTDFQS
jgi:hypothetical protein